MLMEFCVPKILETTQLALHLPVLGDVVLTVTVPDFVVSWRLVALIIVVLAALGAIKVVPEPLRLSEPAPLTMLQDTLGLNEPVPVTLAVKTLFEFVVTLAGLEVTVTSVIVPVPRHEIRLAAKSRTVNGLVINLLLTSEIRIPSKT
jgi:hypothetical protein